MDLLIRFAKIEDAEELLALYTPYVTDTVITFEYESSVAGRIQRSNASDDEKVPVSGRRTEWRDSWI